MKIAVSLRMFKQAFRDYGREEQFSEEGLEAMFEFIENMEADTGMEWELDVIALCCEFTEYDNIGEFNYDYDTEYEGVEELEYDSDYYITRVGEEGILLWQ